MSLNPPDEPLRFDRPPRFEMVTPLLKIKPGVVATAVLISSQPQGYYGHYAAKVTRICTLHLGQCPICDEGKIGRRWAGFLHAVDASYNKDFFIHLTNRARDEIEDLMEGEEDWKGSAFQMARKNANPQSVICYTRLKIHYLDRPLPEEKSVMPTLRRVWRFEN